MIPIKSLELYHRGSAHHSRQESCMPEKNPLPCNFQHIKMCGKSNFRTASITARKTPPGHLSQTLPGWRFWAFSVKYSISSVKYLARKLGEQYVSLVFHTARRLSRNGLLYTKLAYITGTHFELYSTTKHSCPHPLPRTLSIHPQTRQSL